MTTYVCRAKCTDDSPGVDIVFQLDEEGSVEWWEVWLREDEITDMCSPSGELPGWVERRAMEYIDNLRREAREYAEQEALTARRIEEDGEGF